MADRRSESGPSTRTVAPVLELVFTSGDGQQGALRIRHLLEGNDKMKVTIELPQPVTITLIRSRHQ